MIPAGPSPLGLPRVFWVLWLGQFVNRLGGFVLTFLPSFLVAHHHYSDAQTGAVLSLFGLGGLFGSSLSGWASDRFGRRRTLLVMTSASAAVLLLFGAAPAGPPVAAAAFAHGVCNAYGPAITATVGDVVPAADRPRAFGYLYWAVNLGFTFAAALGGLLSTRGFHWLFVGDALTTLALAATVYAFVPETRPPATEGRERPGVGSLPRALSDRRFLGFAVAQFMVLLVFLQSFVTLPLQERARGIDTRGVGLIAAFNGVIIVAAQPPFLRFTKGQPAWRLLSVAALLVSAAALVAASARDVPGFVVSMAVVSLGEVAFSGAAPSFVTHVAPPDRRGTYQGAYSLCWAGASLLAPLLGPGLRGRFGGAVMWTAAAAVSACAALLHAVLTRRAEAAGDERAPA